VLIVDIRQAIERAKSAELVAFGKRGPTTAPVDEGTRELTVEDIVLERIIAAVKAALPSLQSNALRQVAQGDINAAFPKSTDPSDVETGQLARIRGRATFIQVAEDGILLKMDSTKFLLIGSAVNAAEFRAKYGDGVIPDVPLDGIYLIGAPKAYETVAGRTSYYISIMPVGGIVPKTRLQAMISDEAERRERLDRERELEYANTYRHTFVDSTGAYKVDAYAVGLSPDCVDLLRADTLKLVQMPLNRLSRADQEWIEKHQVKIRNRGYEIRELVSGIPTRNEVESRETATLDPTTLRMLNERLPMLLDPRTSPVARFGFVESIAGLTDRVDDLAPDQAAALATYLLAKKRIEEHRAILPHIEAFGKWKQVRLAVADQLEGVGLSREQLQEIVSKLLGREYVVGAGDTGREALRVELRGHQ